MNTEPKFKIGDEVRIINGPRTGKTFVIEKMDNRLSWIYWAKDTIMGEYERDLELAKESIIEDWESELNE